MVSYDTKANLTTVASAYLIPLLVGYGISFETSSAIVGIFVSVILIVFGMVNEMYTSKHLTRDNPEVIEDDGGNVGLSEIISEEVSSDNGLTGISIGDDC